jgi:hypothetical protein
MNQDKPTLANMFAMIASLRDGYRTPNGIGSSHPQSTRDALSDQMDWLLKNYAHLNPND